MQFLEFILFIIFFKIENLLFYKDDRNIMLELHFVSPKKYLHFDPTSLTNRN